MMLRVQDLFGLLTIMFAALEIGFTQADCPFPHNRRNAVLKIHPSQQGQRLRLLMEGSLATYSCYPGFDHTRGDKTLVCLNGKWKVIRGRKSRSPIPFQCSEKLCLEQIIPNGKMQVIDNKNVTYSCNHGYGLSGVEHSYCRMDENGDFYITEPLPTCDPLSECKLPIALNLQIKGNCCFTGDEVTFFCDAGYVIQGVSSAVCMRTGNWSQPTPNCAKIKQCADPGIHIRSNRTGNCCEIGSVLKYGCHEGYELMDKENGKTITCLPNEEWDKSIPLCKPFGKVACPNIPIEKNNLTIISEMPSDEDVFLDGSEVELACKPGFYTDDEELYLLCDSDGAWDVAVPVCKPKAPCSRPLAPSHGLIPKLIMNPNQTEFPLGFEIEMECEAGYISKNGFYGSQCEGNDVWSKYLDCTRITCSDPGFPNNGYRQGDDFHFKSSVTFGCMGGYQLIGSPVRTCQENGRWSGFTTICDAGGSDCLDPGMPVNSYRKGNKFNVGDVVTYSCKKRTTLIGNGTRECLDGQDGAYWSGSEIECQAQHEFTDKDDAAVVLSETVAAVSRPSLQGPEALYVARMLGNQNKIGVSGTDIFFAFDGSASITEKEFEDAKDFVITFIRQVGISHSNGGIRVAVILFSKNVQEVVQLTTRTIGEATRELKKMTGNRKGTDISNGLKRLGDLAQRSIKTNANRKKIAFIITDGMWNMGGDPSTIAKQLRDPHIYNVELFAVGIGRHRNDLALYEIVGSDKSHLLLFESYEELVKIAANAIKRDLDYSACGFERPVSFNDPSSKGNRKRVNSQLLARIVGGQEVKRPWPWMAALSKKGETSCGGSIIHQQWILTAAHCFMEDSSDPSDWLVTVGATDLTKSTGWDLRVESILIHDNYNPETLDFDAALVKLKLLVPYDLYIRPICLPPAFKALPNNTELHAKDNDAMVIGYGHTEVMEFSDGRAKSVDILQELELKLQSKEVCQKEVTHGNFRIQPTPQMICAGSGLGGKDACKGDSGGPLMQMTDSTSRNNTQERWFLVGIKSWGVGCGLKGYYGYYSYVAKLREWIENSTNVEFENVIPQPKVILRG